MGMLAVSESKDTVHTVIVDQLIPSKDYWYRFGIRRDSTRLFSDIFQLEGAMNYAPPVVKSKVNASVPRAIVKHLPQRGGFAVVVDGVDPDWAKLIASETSMTVIYATNDESLQQSLRASWYADEDYGIRLNVKRFDALPESFANILVAPKDDIAKVADLLAPLGKVISLGSPPHDAGFEWVEIAGVSPSQGQVGTRSDPPSLPAWGHQYGSAANTSYSGETLGGVDDASELKVKWLGKPGADFGIDRNPRMPAPLAVGGRLFHQGMNRMIALDAFNGAVLWSLEIPDLRRVNIPRDSANWCADETNVFAAVRDKLWMIDAANGNVERTLYLPEERQQRYQWGYVAVTDDRVVGTAVKQGSAYSTFWNKAAWYDGKDDAATAKVCSNLVVGYDKAYGSIEWQHAADAIVNSTITINGNKIYFVQIDDPSLRELESSKLENAKLWHAASVVCLDLATGEELWKVKVPPQDHEAIVSFGIADDEQFILQTSGKNAFHFVSMTADSGQPRWTRSVAWPEDHHGAHVQHAVLMNGQLFVQPHILDATDGQIVKSGTLGKRRGCATPIGAGNSIIYRGGSGPLSLWSLKNDSRSEFARLRPSCWLSTVPAQGMLFSPEGGGGCSCGGWMETSIGFAPMPDLEGSEK